MVAQNCETGYVALHICLWGFAPEVHDSNMYLHLQGVTSPLAGQMLFRSVMFGAFAQIKTWMATNKDGSTRQLTNADFYKVSIGHFAFCNTSKFTVCI